MGLEQTSYTALESDESVEVCAVTANNCTDAFSLIVRFRTLDGSAGTQLITVLGYSHLYYIYLQM